MQANLTVNATLIFKEDFRDAGFREVIGYRIRLVVELGTEFRYLVGLQDCSAMNTSKYLGNVKNYVPILHKIIYLRNDLSRLLPHHECYSKILHTYEYCIISM